LDLLDDLDDDILESEPVDDFDDVVEDLDALADDEN
jgi:hypothetical protein